MLQSTLRRANARLSIVNGGLCFFLFAAWFGVAQDPGVIDPAIPNAPKDQTESLADRARKLRSSKSKEAQTTQQDAKTLFRLGRRDFFLCEQRYRVPYPLQCQPEID
jgi:hypothetical protein